MNKNKIITISTIILIFIIIIISSLLLKFVKINNYRNKEISINKVIINYPIFNNKSDNTIKQYLNNVNLAIIDKIDYQTNKVDNYTSVLFKLYKNDKIKDYQGFIFNKNGDIINANDIINDMNVLNDKIKLVSVNKGLQLSNENLEYADYSYYLEKNELKVYLTNYNTKKDISFVVINYNELKNVLNMKVTYDTNYKMLTTTTLVPRKLIAFTFDDGPSKYTEELLDILDKYKAKATFFEVGYMIKERPEVVLDVYKRGFEIGNHTVDHYSLAKLKDPQLINAKIDDNNALFNAITKSNMVLVRPPYGATNELVRSTVAHPLITWSVDPDDWKDRDTDIVVGRVKDTVQEGDIVLFHDLYPTTIEAVRQLLPYLYDNNYQVVSVSELFRSKNITLENGVVYRKAR